MWGKAFIDSDIVSCDVSLGVLGFFDYMENLKVAVVNDDASVTFQCEELFLDDEMTGALEDNKAFDWEFVDREKVRAGR